MYNILICDDEADIVSALKIYLASPDMNFFTAKTGREAICLPSTSPANATVRVEGLIEAWRVIAEDLK